MNPETSIKIKPKNPRGRLFVRRRHPCAQSHRQHKSPTGAAFRDRRDLGPRKRADYRPFVCVLRHLSRVYLHAGSEALVLKVAEAVECVHVVSAKTFDRLSERDSPTGFWASAASLSKSRRICALGGGAGGRAGRAGDSRQHRHHHPHKRRRGGGRGVHLQPPGAHRPSQGHQGSMARPLRSGGGVCRRGGVLRLAARSGFLGLLADTRAKKAYYDTTTGALCAQSWAASATASPNSGIPMKRTCS